jgi:hypothetical protein
LSTVPDEGASDGSSITSSEDNILLNKASFKE